MSTETRTDEWPAERVAADIQAFNRARATVVSVEDLLATNAGDELHVEANWFECAECGADVPIDYDSCWRCGR